MVSASPNKSTDPTGNEKGSYFSSPVAASLPKGGGAIRSIGEKFSVNPVTGTGGVTVPIFTTVSRSDFYPKLSLSYDSGGGNGAFGLGWNLSVPSITRKTDKGLPRYDDASESDIFILSGAEDLVPVLKVDGSREVLESPDRQFKIQRYRPRIEGLFARIERWTKLDSGEIHWRSLSKDNVTSIYGQTASLQSKIADPEHPSRIFKWLLEASYDDRGNLIVYEYKQENSDQVPQEVVSEKNRLLVPQANVYLKRIKYGNRTPYKQGDKKPTGDLATLANIDNWLFQVVFDYGEHDPTHPTPEGDKPWAYRLDAFSNYRAGFEVRTRCLCQRVLMFHRLDEAGNIADWQLVRSTNFDYDHNPVATYLTKAIQMGYSQETPAGRSYPALEFQYDRPVMDSQIKSIDPKSLKNLPIGLDGNKYQWVDLDSEGISGILTEQATGWLYKRNLGEAHFGTAELVATKPSIANLSNSQQRLMDLAGDGTLDLVSLGKLSGYYERRKSGEWQSFVPFEYSPTVNWNDPNLRFVDVTGDGHADILIAEQEMFIWYPSKAREGFGTAVWVHKLQDEEKGPTLLFADPMQSVFLSDMTGDGLTDIVRIRNGEVCYWPNLGYGQFGAKVTLAGSPQFAHPEWFDPKRIRLADIDGSGTTDIIYLGRGELQVWFNQAGNSLRKHGSYEGERPISFPPMDNLASVQTVDLFGNGTACVVWSSSLPGVETQPIYYIDLMGGQKPHLLRSFVNNMGAETRFQYAASTKFYLQDLVEGKPWLTRLPFPVHVVEQVETLDRVSGNRLVTRYHYRHGYFDGVEREFRGFGYVEQLDTEEFGKFQAGGGTNALAEGLHVPPVQTKTWFHTGAYLDRESLEVAFRKEYYALDARATFLDDTVLPGGLTGDEGRQACRALKGQMLRQEIYALDGSEKRQHPYTVTESNYQIRKVQSMGAQRYGVFFTHPRESLVYHYERNSSDPRIAHSMTLEVDEFGNVLKSVAIAYPRRSPAYDEQKELLVTYTENQVANQPNESSWYRIGVPIKTLTYEITGIAPKEIEPVKDKRFTLTDFYKADGSSQAIGYFRAEIIGYKDKPDKNKPQKRLIEHVKTLYRKDSDANTIDPAKLELGEIDSLALPYESFKLAFTSGLLTQIYGEKIPAGQLDGLLRTEGGYFKFKDIDGWWIPSGRQAFNPVEFYLPVQMQDPFGKVYQTAYDQYHLLPISTVDPLQNTILIQNNYRVMQPQRITDPNGNRSEVAFDALGMVVGTAVMGKESESLGDSFATFNPDLADGDIKAFFDAPDPRSLAIQYLGTATTRFIYDLTHTPVCAAAIARKKHVSDLAGQPLTPDDVQVSFVYSDGFSREAQTKIQAEPGPLDLSNPTLPFAKPRWVGTGTKVYNNKGKPVRQFEPFFSRDHLFGIEQHGVSSTLFYDPVERVVATLHPNHTYEKVVFDPWQQVTYDVNDTVAAQGTETGDPRNDPDISGYVAEYFKTQPATWQTWYAQRQGGALGAQEQAAAKQAADHANTPTITHFDTLGRTFLTIADNGAAGKYETCTELDIEGNQRSVTDAKDRIVMRYDYDLLSNVIHQDSMEAGERWILNNVAGKPIRQWDSRGFTRRLTYDPLLRPLDLFVTDKASQVEKLAERTIYGEAQGNALNHRGKVYQVLDGAGVVTHQAYDFKGNLLRSSRQLLQNYRDLVDWGQRQQPGLEAGSFDSRTAYDALNRPVAMTMPDRSVVRPTYNEANLLERVEANLQGAAVATPFVTDLNYNAKGQRVLIAYANGVKTQYEYDEQTYRLMRLQTLQGSKPLQDLRYTYDPVGNITTIRDTAQQKIFFNNEVVVPENQYTYDAVYRLIEATGREHIGQVGQPETSWNDEFRVNLPLPGDGQAMRKYKEQYSYDAVGNFEALIHQATNGDWTRKYAYNEVSLIEPGKQSNRLSSTTVGQRTEPYTYDLHGNMTQMPHLGVMEWDFKDQLQMTQQQVVNSGTGERTYYVYDATGQRVRKVTEGQGRNRRKERIYLGGYEIYKEYGVGNSPTLERETLHVMDNQQRIALVETERGSSQRLIRFQLGNHLGSASLEVDDSGQVISYEESYPYGSTSYQAVEKGIKAAAKRYRYTGKERDEESGLYYHGARYYAPWLGRWTSFDPAILKASKFDSTTSDSYVYVQDRPLVGVDPNGEAIQIPAAIGLALAGAAIGGGLETARQLMTHGEVNKRAIAAASAGGAASGAIAGLTMGGSLLAEAYVATTASVVGGEVTRRLMGENTSPSTMLQDATTGLATFGVLKGTQSLAESGKINKLFQSGKEKVSNLFKSSERKISIKELTSSGSGLKEQIINPNSLKESPNPLHNPDGVKVRNIEAALEGNKRHSVHKQLTKQNADQFEGTGWRPVSIDQTLGGKRRPDTVFVNDQQKRIVVEDLYTGNKKDVLTSSGYESSPHYRKGWSYANEPKIKELIDKGYTFEYVVSPWNTQKKPFDRN